MSFPFTPLQFISLHSIVFHSSSALHPNPTPLFFFFGTVAYRHTETFTRHFPFPFPSRPKTKPSGGEKNIFISLDVHYSLLRVPTKYLLYNMQNLSSITYTLPQKAGTSPNCFHPPVFSFLSCLLATLPALLLPLLSSIM